MIKKSAENNSVFIVIVFKSYSFNINFLKVTFGLSIMLLEFIKVGADFMGL